MIKNYTCSKCYKSCNRKSTYNDHMYKRKTTCNKEEIDLANNLIINSANPSTFCNKNVNKINNMQNKKILICEYCKKKYAYRQSLNYHIKNNCCSLIAQRSKNLLLY